jgi:hypothetical protein
VNVYSRRVNVYNTGLNVYDAPETKESRVALHPGARGTFSGG